jgi:hypothetical protein
MLRARPANPRAALLPPHALGCCRLVMLGAASCATPPQSGVHLTQAGRTSKRNLRRAQGERYSAAPPS